jgi:hypothetical protein
MRKSVGQAPTAGEQTQQKPCRTSSDIGTELENHSRTGSDVGSERVKLYIVSNTIYCPGQIEYYKMYVKFQLLSRNCMYIYDMKQIKIWFYQESKLWRFNYTHYIRTAKGRALEYFYVLLNVQHLGIISVNNQLDAQLFAMHVYFYSLHVSGSHVPIIRGINCINTTSGVWYFV